jgi:hypothetical protein
MPKHLCRTVNNRYKFADHAETSSLYAVAIRSSGSIPMFARSTSLYNLRVCVGSERRSADPEIQDVNGG